MTIETNFPYVVGTAVTTAILACGVQTSAQMTPIQSSVLNNGVPQVTEYINLARLFDRYKLITNDNFKQESQIETIHNFASNILENIEELPPEFSEAVDAHFWELI